MPDDIELVQRRKLAVKNKDRRATLSRPGTASAFDGADDDEEE